MHKIQNTEVERYLSFQEFLLNTVAGIVHGVAHAGTNLMHNIFGEEVEKRALTAKEEVRMEFSARLNNSILTKPKFLP